ncbi:MAG: threonine/serine dehydratase [Pseudomonadota bacterium]
MTDIATIRDAARVLDGHVRRTPLLNDPALDEIAGRRLWVKAECLQHTGSFKARGAWYALARLAEDARRRGVVAFSSGNHAQGVARAARAFGAPAVIIMPADAPKTKIANTRALGAEVVLYDRASEDRDLIGAELSRSRGLTLVKPFDDVHVIAGQGTTGLEIAEQAREAGITRADVAVCCGGGGLTSGIAVALAAEAPGLTVHPVEPEGFDDVTRSLAHGQILRNTRRAGSVCDAILTEAPGALTFPLMAAHCGPGVVVSDAECLRAMALAMARLNLVVEPGGAAGLAAALFHPDAFSGSDVIAVATGGNVDRPMIERALAAA